MQQLRQIVALVDKLTNTYIHVYYICGARPSCLFKAVQRKRTDTCETIIKHELPMECKVKN